MGMFMMYKLLGFAVRRLLQPDSLRSVDGFFVSAFRGGFNLCRMRSLVRSASS